MPKRQQLQQQQQQQKQKQDNNQQDVELSRLVRRAPLPPPHHPHLQSRSRSPSPSSPNGSILELPNVPSYPRLPPIVSSPSKHPRSLSGLSNPAFFIEDDSDISALRTAGESTSV